MLPLSCEADQLRTLCEVLLTRASLTHSGILLYKQDLFAFDKNEPRICVADKKNELCPA